MGKQNLGGIYANMDFPPYQYIEYPKHIRTGPYGQFQIAYNEEDEKVIIEKLSKNYDDTLPEPIPVFTDPEKDILISRAHELGVPINRKWSKAKIQQAVELAEADVDSLPAELPEVVEKAKEENTEVVENKLNQLYEYESSDEYKDKLIAQAKTLGIHNVSRLWGIPRLKASIAEAQQK